MASVKYKRAFQRNRFIWRQMRDTIEGPNAVKRAHEVYLPMPSAMLMYQEPPSIAHRQHSNTFQGATQDYNVELLPWFHPNKPYMAYLQRARFPDITANALRGLVGIATKVEPTIKIPGAIAYLEESITPTGYSLQELFGYVVSELLVTSKVALVLDVRESDNTFYTSSYTAESNIDWDYEIVDGEVLLTKMVFVEESDEYEQEQQEVCTIHYELLPDKADGEIVAHVWKEVNGTVTEEPRPITFIGRRLPILPIVCFGAEDNDPNPDAIPLLGISECALSIYRKDADKSQAQFMTCNPTLILKGVHDDSKPAAIGSTVCINLPPNGDAYYTTTDTSALEHMRSDIQDLFKEAADYGAALLGGGKKAAESFEALSLRKAASGANLVSVVRQAARGIEDLLEIATLWIGSKFKVQFEASIDFAEHELDPGMLTALVSSWIQGAISHDTLLNKLRESNVVAQDVTNDQERKKIIQEQEASLGMDDDEDGENEDQDGKEPSGAGDKDESDTQEKDGQDDETEA